MKTFTDMARLYYLHFKSMKKQIHRSFIKNYGVTTEVQIRSFHLIFYLHQPVQIKPIFTLSHPGHSL